jgi:hypothetical protein
MREVGKLACLWQAFKASPQKRAAIKIGFGELEAEMFLQKHPHVKQ